MLEILLYIYISKISKYWLIIKLSLSFFYYVSDTTTTKERERNRMPEDKRS